MQYCCNIDLNICKSQKMVIILLYFTSGNSRRLSSNSIPDATFNYRSG